LFEHAIEALRALEIRSAPRQVRTLRPPFLTIRKFAALFYEKVLDEQLNFDD
jgi:hypothetical protein